MGQHGGKQETEGQQQGNESQTLEGNVRGRKLRGQGQETQRHKETEQSWARARAGGDPT